VSAASALWTRARAFLLHPVFGPVEPGLKIVTNSEKVLGARRTLLELMMADHPSPCARQLNSGDCELETLATAAGASQPRFAKRTVARGKDASSSPSRSTMTLASCAIAASAAATKSKIISCLAAWAKAIPPASLSISILQWAIPRAFPAAECMVSCPTGALTNKGVVGTAIATGPGAQGFEAEELLQIPVFKGVSGTFLELNRGAIVKHRFHKGEIICREGEFGSTAFYILEGQALVSISTPIAHVKTQGGAKGFFKRLTSTLVAREQDKREEERGTEPFPSTRRSTFLMATPSPNLAPAISLAK